MRLKKVVEILGARVVLGADRLNDEVEFGFASDLMSDVLTIETDGLLLITSLTNLQAIRTAEMADINHLLFVRNKKATPEMIDLAGENGFILMESELPMFKVVSLLHEAGLKPIC